MKPIVRHFLLLLCLMTGSATAIAQQFVLRQSNPSGIYHRGDLLRVTLFMNDHRRDSVKVAIRENYSRTLSHETHYCNADSLVIFERAMDQPTTFIFEASLHGETHSIGAICDPEKFTPGTLRPKDLDAYWDSEKKILRALPMESKLSPVKESGNGYRCFDVEINCTGPQPARGYFAKPESARLHSLPIVLLVHAAGVSGSWCRSTPFNALGYAGRGQGALCFDLNAHGMLNGQPDTYYTALENGELKDYAKKGVENRDEIYFRGMYLRLLRTLDFLTAQPEWDGQRIIVIGESQGGGQALAAAGLDPRVTAVVAIVPAMCDWGGSLVGRRGGWPQLFEVKGDPAKMKATLPYFDNAHLLKGSKATIFTEIGLIDLTCPSSAVYAAINQSSGKKIIFAVPFREHHQSQDPIDKVFWEKNVHQPREKFISDFLK